MADTPTATFAVDSAWLRESAAILLDAAESIDNLTRTTKVESTDG